MSAAKKKATRKVVLAKSATHNTRKPKANGINVITQDEFRKLKLGAKFGGGFVFGAYMEGFEPRLLIRAPRALGEMEPMVWNGNHKRVDGALSPTDSLANTLAMAEAGSELAKKILALKIEGLTDWALMAQIPALTMFHNQRLIKLPNEEQFRQEWHYTSTQCPRPADSGYAFVQGVGGGISYWLLKSHKFRGFAVRSLIIQ